MNTLKAVLFVSGLIGLSAPAVYADNGTQVFRSVDAQGNVVFTDTPQKGAKPVDIQAPSSVQAITPPPQVETPSAAPQDPSAFIGYQSMVITQPENGAALNNGAGDVDVSVSLVPALRTDLGHGLTITMDGKAVLQNSARMNVALADVDRGEHVLEAFVLNGQGQVVFQSAPSRFSLQRTSLLLPGRAHQVPTPRVAP
ncbi:MAG TPA: DUF4124 domain-containing protein [bacterium]|mgnify:CR=1 FL=1|nr:DUF4124 domain-containing protein [bacterium]